jgi:hypothetical protein
MYYLQRKILSEKSISETSKNIPLGLGGKQRLTRETDQAKASTADSESGS